MTVTIDSWVSCSGDTADAVAELDAQLSAAPRDAAPGDAGSRDAASGNPSCLFIFYSERYDDHLVADFVRRRFPGVPVIGGTSSNGVLDRRGPAGPMSIGLLLISDPDGRYGTASTVLSDDPASDAEQAMVQALHAAGAPGELPELVWVYQADGAEESVVAGIRRVVGNRCPVVGGTSAADDLLGKRRQFGPAGPISDGVVVAALFPSGGVSCAYQGGYQPTGEYGVVTELGPLGFVPGEGGFPDSSREITLIDGEPAAVVYQRWLAGQLSDKMMHGVSPIDVTSVHAPLGLDMGAAGEVTYFRLIQPIAVTPSQGLLTAASVAAGRQVYAMRGYQRGLMRRPARVAYAARTELADNRREVAGALMAYCAGCRVAVGTDLAESIAGVATELPEVPLLGCFTGGEQGPAMGENVHANLMISAVVFGR